MEHDMVDDIETATHRDYMVDRGIYGCMYICVCLYMYAYTHSDG